VLESPCALILLKVFNVVEESGIFDGDERRSID